jgi:4-diphosphocytidyl-2-C-methyl-D-erythritol kinase
MNKYLAPAKVNLHLAVTGVLDHGFHALDTSFVYVDAYDILSIAPSDTLQVRCSIEALSGESNLVYQVLKAFQEKHDVTQGLAVLIEKHLPAQAGLGGGSSDAATALMVANKLWQIGCTKEELIDFAKPFGADIPCFLFTQASLAQGVGEKLTPYTKDIPSEHVVLAWPGEGVSTAAAFKHFDENKFHALTDEKAGAKVRARSEVGDFELGYNDLEKSAIALCSPLQDLLLLMRQQSIRAWMSGSGSACVALCHSEDDAHKLVALLQQKALVSWVHVGHFLPKHPLNIGA